MAAQQARGNEDSAQGPLRKIDRVILKIGVPLLILTIASAGLLWWWGLAGTATLIVVSTALIFSLPVPFLYFLHNKVQHPALKEEIKKGLGTWNMSEKLSEVMELTEETIGERYFYLPLILATVITFLGWLTVLLATGTKIWNEAASLQIVIENLTQKAPPVTFGFLGAYFFSNQYLMRRFLREDLKPQAFTQVAVRILSSIVIAYVISIDGLVPTEAQVPTRWTLCALAFLAGLSPYEVVLWIQDRVSRTVGLKQRQVDPEMKLDQIQGLTRWDEARLIEEGVENLQHLASRSPVELLVRTRFGAQRIRDWINQAYLLIHIPADQRNEFKGCYIRTATDFLRVYEENEDLLIKKIPAAELLAKSILKGPNSHFLFGEVLEEVRAVRRQTEGKRAR